MSRTLTFYGKNRDLAAAAVALLEQERPMTLRQLYYRCVSAGLLANQQAEYQRLGKLLTRLREAGAVPRRWLVDHVRATLKPSSWSGLADFGSTVREAYRKDFWASLEHHVEVFVEKDAVAGTIQPVTAEHDVALRVCRGYASVSFAGEIADDWQEIAKPIFAYYVGDFDPSGFDLERDLRDKLARYSGKHCVHSPDTLADHLQLCRHPSYLAGDAFCWVRLAVLASDFADHDLIALPVKPGDRRTKGFLDQHGHACAEVDALPPSVLRQRVGQAVAAHIDQDRWQRLRHIEEVEQHALHQLVGGWGRNGT